MAVTDSDDDTLSVLGAARLLRVSIQTVHAWADSGRIPSWRTQGGHRRFSAAALYAVGRIPAPPKRQVDVEADAWAVTIEQVLEAAAEHFESAGDGRRAMILRRTSGSLGRRLRGPGIARAETTPGSDEPASAA
jgi:excisionase family DNA binding protein